MKLHNFIAWRYLFAKKSHNVINVISIISATGIAVGCAALIIVLSIYNGFDSIVRQLNDSHTADLLIEPAEGKTFVRDAAFDFLDSDPRIKAACGVICESVFVQYGNNHQVVVAKGVDSLYEEVTGLKDYIVEGSFEMKYGEVTEVVAGRTVAMALGMRTTFLQPLTAYFPSRNKDVDLLNPAASLNSVRLFPSGIISLEQDFDSKYIFIPLDALRALLEYDDEVSQIEIYLQEEALTGKGVAPRSLQEEVEARIGDSFTVRNRYEQNPTLYKLLMYEKIAIYLILLFVILIVSFNIFGSLSMLIIDKKDDMETLRSMGADQAFVNRIFVREGWLITACGAVVGVLAGLLVCFLQQKLGLVKMPGSFVVDAYPVVVQVLDVVLVMAGVAAIGFIISKMTKGRNPV